MLWQAQGPGSTSEVRQVICIMVLMIVEFLPGLIMINPFCLICSFVRSVTMDKWKDIELEKMKVGGNGEFRKFLELQDDYDPTWNLQEKYNSKPAALFRDKVRCAPL